MVVDTQEIVPWLALGVASGSLVWQLMEARRRRATRVRIEIQHAGIPASIHGPDLLNVPALGHTQQPIIWPTDEHLHYVVAVTAVNLGETTELVLDIILRDLEESAGAGANPGGVAKELLPRGRLTWALRPEELLFDVSNGFRAGVVLGATTIMSGPHYLDDRVIEAIDEHNQALDRGP